MSKHVDQPVLWQEVERPVYSLKVEKSLGVENFPAKLLKIGWGEQTKSLTALGAKRNDRKNRPIHKSCHF